MGNSNEDFEWQYGETVRATCPDCGHRVAIETGVHEFAGVRCVECDSRMEAETR